MGILSGFIGGAARATGEIANQRIARYTAEELQRQRDLIDQEREKRIEEAQMAREGRAIAQRDKERTDTVSRIDAEAGRIADAEIGKQRGLIYSKQELLEQTPEWQDQTEQELASKRQSIASDHNTRFAASVNTGDTSQKEAQAYFDSSRRIELAEKQQEVANANAAMRDATERYKADLRAKSDEAKDATNNKRLDVMLSSIRGGSNGKVDKVMSLLEGTRKSLNGESDRLSDLMKSELKGVENDPAAQAKIREEYKPKFDQLNLQQKNLNDDFNSVRQRFGLPVREDSKPSSSQSGDDPFAAAFAEKLKEVQGAKKPQGQSQNNPATTNPTGLIDPPRAKIDTAARDASIARMNTLSGSSNNRSTIITKKEEEISSNLQDKISQIQRGMSRDEKFKLFTWFDENGGYMTPAQLKQVRDAKLKAGM